MMSEKLFTFITSFFGLNMLYLFASPFIMMLLIIKIEERMVDLTMLIISIVVEILIILFSLLLSYKLNCGGDE